MYSQLTYIWIDGTRPTNMLRSKMRIIKHPDGDMTLQDLPEWGFDGSSTFQAKGENSDLVLTPAAFVDDPILGDGNYLVMCEVMHQDGTPHETNKRAHLRKLLAQTTDHEPWIGFEQEYTLFNGSTPLGWPVNGYPAPQGPFYCGVGADEAFGRQLVEEHTRACIDAGIMIYGTNAEVMPGQWEFQVGPRGDENESPDPLTICDHLWIARWLLYRIGEDFGITATLDPKPVKGDWNGAGQHTNFSTKAMRDASTGRATIEAAIDRLAKNHMRHIAVYGHGLDERLTGTHETSNITDFSWGYSDRGASIRVPYSVHEKGYGYIEDRRPGANANPYEIAAALVETVCEASVAQEAKETA